MFCKQCGEKIDQPECPKCGQLNKQPDSNNQANVSSLFLEPDETVVETLSRGYISNYLLSGSVSSESLVISNKRLYYNGSFFSRKIGVGNKLTGMVVLPLEHITSLSVGYYRNLLQLFGSILMFLFSMPLIAIGVGSRRAEAFLVFGIFVLCISVIGFVLFLFGRKRLLTISSATSTVMIDYRLYGEAKIHRFIQRLGEATSKRTRDT